MRPTQPVLFLYIAHGWPFIVWACFVRKTQTTVDITPTYKKANAVQTISLIFQFLPGSKGLSGGSLARCARRRILRAFGALCNAHCRRRGFLATSHSCGRLRTVPACRSHRGLLDDSPRLFGGHFRPAFSSSLRVFREGLRFSRAWMSSLIAPSVRMPAGIMTGGYSGFIFLSTYTHGIKMSTETK